MAARVDWTFIKNLYEAGTLSIREIARQYTDVYSDQDHFKKSVTDTAIRKKAREKNWGRRLADKIRERAEEKLVRAQFAVSTQGKTTDQIDEETIDFGSEMILKRKQYHLARIDNVFAMLDILRGQLLMALKDPEIPIVDKTRSVKAFTEAEQKTTLSDRISRGFDRMKVEIDGPDRIELIQIFGDNKN